MADRIQLDGKMYLPLMEGAAMVGISEKDVHALGLTGKVFLRAIGKKIYVDIDGLQAAVRGAVATSTPAPAPQATVITEIPKPRPVVVPAPAPVAPPITPPATAPSVRLVAAAAPLPATAPVTASARVQPAALVTAAPAPVKPAPVPVQNVASPAAAAPAVPIKAPMKAPVHMSSAELSAMGTPNIEPVPAAKPVPQPAALPRIVLPPGNFGARTSTPSSVLATPVAALAALVLVLGSSFAAYRTSPEAARFVSGIRERLVAAAGFGGELTYQAGTLSGPAAFTPGPTDNQTAANIATVPSANGMLQPIYYVYNYPVIERVRTELQYITAETPQDFESQLADLYARIQSQIQGLNITTNTQFAQQYQVISQTNNIDKLGGVTIDGNSTFSGGTITGSTLTDIASLSVSGGTTLGGLTVGDITASGGGTFSGAGIFSYVTASSTSATSTFNGALLATRAPTTAHTFSSWDIGASNSAWWDAALVINPASAVGDSNLLSAAVNGSVKFLVDAEGDVFVNNLTSVGSVTLSTTSASSFTVEGNTTLGDSITDTTTINGTLVVSGTTTASTVSGKFGVGTTTPWAKLAVQATAGQTYPIFEVASSSTGTAYLTISSSGNVGVGTTSPSATLAVAGTLRTTGTNTFEGALSIAGAITSTATSANTFPYASSTALTVSGTSYFNVASTSQLSVFDKAYFGGTATSTFDSLGNLYVTGTLGVGTTSPLRKFAVEQAASAAQLAVAYDTTRVTEIQTDSSGDVILNPSGDDVRINDDNLWVCSGGSCPTGTPSGNGNVLVESKLGLGTSTPNAKLGVLGSITDTVGGASVLELGAAGDIPYWNVRLDGSADLAFDSYVSSWTNRLFIDRQSGYMGVGSSTPTDMLSVQGLLRVGANSNSSVTMGTATSTFNGDIKILGKLDVATIDPVYTIDGIKYATYGHSTVGIKEEMTQKILPSVWSGEKNMYAYVIDFDTLERASDMWLFYQVTDFGKGWENLVVSLAPGFDGRTYYEENLAENTLTIYASESAPVSLRLIANRYDFSKWGNVRPDQDDDFTHFELDSK